MSIAETESGAAAETLDWGRALLAGLIGTVAITITMALAGTDLMRMLGATMLPGAGVGAQYFAGGTIHLMVGLFYGVLFAWLMGPVRPWGRVLKGAVYGVVLTAFALAFMPPMMAMMGPEPAAAPCAPCAPCAPAAAPCAPCAPCAPAEPPCAPCAEHEPMAPCAEHEPMAPCAEHEPMAPCAEYGAASPCAPCTPCAPAAACAPCASAAAGGPCAPCGGAGPWDGVISLIHHLIYGLVVAFVYVRR
jgi:hypothetical protein